MRKLWSKDEDNVMREHYADSTMEEMLLLLDRNESKIYNRAFSLKLKKSQSFLSSNKSGRIKKGESRGDKTAFKKGMIPWNKGKNFEACGRSKETQFKEGRKPHNWKPVGTERISPDGILQVKVKDTRNKSDWIGKHILLWEKENGKIPKGKFLIFKNKDKTDITIENLELVTRSENMKINSVHNLPKELANLVQLRGALNRQINKRAKNEKQN